MHKDYRTRGPTTSKALEKLFAVLKKKRTITARDEEVIQDALSAIEEVRRQKHAKSRA